MPSDEGASENDSSLSSMIAAWDIDANKADGDHENIIPPPLEKNEHFHGPLSQGRFTCRANTIHHYFVCSFDHS
jgi:hypothetical protein